MFLVRGSYVAGILIWITAIFAGTRVLLTYEYTPSRLGMPSEKWPSSSQIKRSPGKFSLVMLLHPDCPCSQASVTELDRLMAQLHGRLAAAVVFVKPASSDEDVQATGLWKRAAAIPEVAVLNDNLGRETGLFGGSVSGEAMLYDPHGNLLFHGGITASRGHEGDNEGSDSIRRLVRGETHVAAHTPAFGCSLRDPDQQALEEDPAWKKR
jgi:hypothetical protein